eukprot:462426_1
MNYKYIEWNMTYSILISRTIDEQKQFDSINLYIMNAMWKDHAHNIGFHDRLAFDCLNNDMYNKYCNVSVDKPIGGTIIKCYGHGVLSIDIISDISSMTTSSVQIIAGDGDKTYGSIIIYNINHTDRFSTNIGILNFVN